MGSRACLRRRASRSSRCCGVRRQVSGVGCVEMRRIEAKASRHTRRKMLGKCAARQGVWAWEGQGQGQGH